MKVLLMFTGFHDPYAVGLVGGGFNYLEQNGDKLWQTYWTASASIPRSATANRA